MPDIVIVLGCLSQCLEQTALRQLHQIVPAMVAMTGRVTMLGLSFLQAILAFARRAFNPPAFRLTVATFNQRAIHLYEQAGFQPTYTFMSQTTPNSHEFMQMVRAG